MKFNEKKTTQLAAYFLQKSNGTLFLIKLLKLLYIADREAFREFGHPITFDKYVSMDNGPVLSQTYDIMTGSNAQFEGYWSAMISDRSGHKLSISDESEISYSSLSDAEMLIADKVFEEYGHIPRFELCEMTHEFDEWEDPKGSSFPIDYENILKAVEYSDEESEFAIKRMHEQQSIDKFFNAV